MRPAGAFRRGLVLALLLLLLSLLATGSLRPPLHSHLVGGAAAAALDDDELQLPTSTAVSQDALVVFALGLCFVLGSVLHSRRHAAGMGAEASSGTSFGLIRPQLSCQTTRRSSQMRRITFLLAVLAAITGIAVAVAPAAPSGAATCTGGPIAAGTYTSLLVTGNCSFAGGTVTVTGNVTVADGALLNDHAVSTATVHVMGNVTVGRDAVLGLGRYAPPVTPAPQSGTVVDGNIVANQPLSLYLGAITVHGNVVSNGGGGGVTGEFRNFPTKDDIIDGNLIVQGWQGGWLGVIRNQVSGNVIVSDNASVRTEDGPGVDTDSNEVMTNVIRGNLVCMGNTPPAQVNPLDGGLPNTVSGVKVGQCAGL